MSFFKPDKKTKFKQVQNLTRFSKIQQEFSKTTPSSVLNTPTRIPLKTNPQNTEDFVKLKQSDSQLKLDETSSISKTSATNPLRLLSGKTVFLDLSVFYKQAGKLKECLDCIDVKFAECLSKDVHYVITNRDDFKPKDSQLNSNLKRANPESPNKNSNKKMRTSPNLLLLGRSNSFIGRAQAIMEKASKGPAALDIIGTAQRLCIPIMHVSELDRYVEKYITKKNTLETIDKSLNAENKTVLNDASCVNSEVNDILFAQDLIQRNKKIEPLHNHKIYKLKSPFMKLESICKQYKPIYEEFNQWHEMDIESTKEKNITCSPFHVYFSSNNEGKSSSTNSSPQKSTSVSVHGKTMDKSNSSHTNLRPLFKSPASSANQGTTPTSVNILPNSVFASSQIEALKSCRTPNSVNILIKSNVIQQSSKFTSKSSKSIVPNPIVSNKKTTKNKPTGYCECCKQRFKDIRQHLTSAQHENFERNSSNFETIDNLINGKLNFDNFLNKLTVD